MGYSCDSGAASSLDAESVLSECLPEEPNDSPWLPEDEIGSRTVRGACAGVLKSRGLSGFSTGCSPRFWTADNDEVLRNVEGVPLNRTILLGYGL